MADRKSTAYVGSPTTKKIVEMFERFRLQKRDYSKYPCGLITGESGSGKTELIRRYLSKNKAYETKERSISPVVYVELVSTVTPKDLAKMLLIGIGDPQKGEGGNATELISRFGRLAAVVKLELIIIDEIQHVFEGRSRKVLTTIADVLKDISNQSKTPMVFFGMPYSQYVIASNDQLNRRTGFRQTIPVFRVSQDFNQYRVYLTRLAEHYGQEAGFDLASREMALRCFASSWGNLGLTSELVFQAYFEAYNKNKLINKKSLASAVTSFGVPDAENVFLMPLNKLVLNELVTSSDWSFSMSRNKQPLSHPEYVSFTLDSQLNLLPV